MALGSSECTKQLASFLAEKISNVNELEGVGFGYGSLFWEASLHIFDSDLPVLRKRLYAQWIKNRHNVRGMLKDLLFLKNQNNSTNNNIEPNINVNLDTKIECSVVESVDSNVDKIANTDNDLTVALEHPFIITNSPKEIFISDRNYFHLQTFRIQFSSILTDSFNFQKDYNYYLCNAIRDVYPNCAPNIKNRRNNLISKTVVIYLYCVYKECLKFVCILNYSQSSEDGFIPAVLNYRGNFNHGEGNIVRRKQIRGHARILAKKELQYMTAHKYKQNKVLGADEKLLSQKTIFDIPTADSARKIKSEADIEKDLDRDDFRALEIMFRDQKNLYIRHFYRTSHTVVYLYLEWCYKLCLDLLEKTSNVALHLDCTGTVVRKFNDNSKRVFYYAGVIHYPIQIDNKVTLPILEMISSSHTSETIGRWLQYYKYGRDLPFNSVVTDFSWALINSAISVFSKMTVVQYLHETHKLLRERSEIPSFITIHICCAHFTKIVASDAKKCAGKNKKLKFFLISGIVNNLMFADNYSISKFLFGDFSTILSNKFSTSSVKMALNRFSNAEVCEFEETSEYSNFFDINENFLLKTLYAKSPFYIDFLRIKQSLFIDDESEDELNPWYCPQFLDVCLQKYMPYLPFWSSLLVKDKDKNVISNSVVEAWFNTVKNYILEKKRNLKCTRFITKLRDYLECTEKEFKFSLLLKKPRNANIRQELQLIEESWCKRRKTTHLRGKAACKELTQIIPENEIGQNIFFKNGIFKYNTIFTKNFVSTVHAYIAKYNLPDFYYTDLDFYDFCTLRDREWVASFIIDLYAQLIIREKPDYIAILCTQLENFKLGCNRSLNIISQVQSGKTIFIPIHQTNHWYLFIANGKSKQFFVLNSLDSFTETAAIKCFGMFQNILNSLGILSSDWELINVTYPKQKDNYNCGVFVMYYIESVVLNHSSLVFEDKFDANKYRLYVQNFLLEKSVVVENYCIHCSRSKATSKTSVWFHCDICGKWQRTASNQNEVFCCNSGCSTTENNWVQCDLCQRWVHFNCLNNTKLHPDEYKSKSYKCRVCSIIKIM